MGESYNLTKKKSKDGLPKDYTQFINKLYDKALPHVVPQAYPQFVTPHVNPGLVPPE
jgi:hypothetical protein